MAEAAVEFLLNNLKQLLAYNADLISSIKAHVESMYSDLGLLNTFVKGTSERRSNDSVVEELVRQIRIEVYKAEDIIDKYVSEAYTQKTRVGAAEVINVPDYLVKLRHVGRKIQDIRKHMKEIYDNKPFANDFFSRTEETIPRSLPCVDEENVFGFEKEAKKVVGCLKAETKELEVISVMGMGGVGKTTLAKKVYNDEDIQCNFPVRSWVYVSQVFNLKEVFLSILYDVTQVSRDASQWSVDTLAKELNRQLNDETYLIVLDDIWTKHAWDELKMAFPSNENGSRILITSRNKDVAIHANTSLGDPYQLRFLTDAESWELLKKKVFPKGTRCSRELENLGKQIARKCYGLPLAIVVIAGILKKMDKAPSSWEKVEKNVTTIEPKQCMEVLELSYKHLPYHLKACFLHFGVFPEDFEIPVRKLIHMWVAEGFIQPTRNTSLEEIAEENLLDLVDRNLVLIEQRRANGGIKTCRIHGMLHDMCVKKAEEENFFKEIKSLEQCIYKAVDLNVFRRVSVYSLASDCISSKHDYSHVRSFLCYGREKTVLNPSQIKCFSESFNLLRVLDAAPITFAMFPSAKLIHLRYIALSGTFNVLPEAVSNLWNLQTLIVNTTNCRNIEVKTDIWKLLQLRHVYTSAASVFPTSSSSSRKGGKDPLVNQNLITMSKVSPDSCTDEILVRTPNLQKLGVCGKLALLMEMKNGKCKFDNITGLRRLDKLKLVNYTYPISPFNVNAKLHALPNSLKFPPMLKKLTLSDTVLKWEQISVLGKLHGLEGTSNWKTNLVHWEAAGHQFPLLQRVSLKHYEQLIAIPSGLGDILTLEVMELFWTPLAVASARLIQRNFKPRVSPDL
ncbi:putative virus X resistance protein-like, coiled-coil [Helianthus annuus]|nr:putative virus X resistance protein-like, coiled-coil [Helianthus annuus]